jgi:acyl-ACP thioesterase
MSSSTNTETEGSSGPGKPLKPNIWTENYTVRSYEVDARGNLAVFSIFNYIQNAASNHADALGVSIRQLLAEGRTWVLSRLLIKIDSYPGWKDTVRVNTWPSGIQGLFALRDFDLKNDAGRSFGSCISAWLIIDSRKRRPVRMSPYLGRLNPLEGNHVLADRLDKIPEIPAPDAGNRFLVGYRDLDLNQHVNSARYIEWALESLPVNVRETCILASLEINFIAEAFRGDRILSSCQSIGAFGEAFGEAVENAFFHNIRREENNQELARVRTVWQPC